jgi:uncharacterized protein
VAFAIGSLAGVSPFARVRVDATAVAYGVAAMLPLLPMLHWSLRTQWNPVRRLVDLVGERLAPYMEGASASGIVLLSFMAGVGEEALFRGAIQAALADRVPAWAAVTIAAALFGVAHWVTPSYALLAGLIGLYLGTLFIMADNVVVPIVAHACYDIVALSILARMKPESGGPVGGRTDSTGRSRHIPSGDTVMTVTQAHAPGTFCWVELGTTDSQAAKRFYTRLFGWKFQDQPIGEDQFYTTFDVGGKQVAALYQQDSQQVAQGVPPHWLSYVSIESADRSAARARELGATVILEPFDVYDFGRMSVIKDPTGAVLGLWEPRSHIGASLVGEPNSFCWNELTTSDTLRAESFYAGLFGWEPQKQPMGDFEYTYFRQGERNNGGMMPIAPEWGPMPPHWEVYFAVDDCDAKAGLSESLGGRIVTPPTDVPGVGRFATLADPQGASFSIIKLLQA